MPATSTSSPAQTTPTGINAFCPKCAYDLRATTSGRCPECGYDLAGLRSPQPIPWEHRRKRGRLRAYLQTAWMVQRFPKQFCENIARPVSYADAQVFRWTTVGVAYLLVFLSTVLVYIEWPPVENGMRPKFDIMQQAVNPQWPVEPAWQVQALYEIWPVSLLHVGLILFFIAATGVPSYLFHPKRAPVAQQNSAIALSYYACWPFSMSALAVMPAGAAVFCSPSDLSAAGAYATLGSLVGFLIATICWKNLLHLAQQGLPQVSGRMLRIGIGAPMFWLIVAMSTLIVFPFILFGIVVLVASLG